jgi:predicted nucleic acid-binding Zn ribbon protein
MNARRFDGRDDDDDPELRAKLAQSGDPQPLRKSLERLVEHMGAPPVSVLTRLTERWPDLVGPALAETTRPVELVDGVLAVACAEPAIAAQVGWMEAQIRQRFDEVFGKGQLDRVVARVDR